MSDISPFGQKCERCKIYLTTRDFVQDNKLCKRCRIELQIEEERKEINETNRRRSTRIRDKKLQQAKQFDIDISSLEQKINSNINSETLKHISIPPKSSKSSKSSNLSYSSKKSKQNEKKPKK